MAAAVFMFSACQSATPTPAPTDTAAANTTSTTTTTTTTTVVTTPTPAEAEPTPAALTKYVVLSQPYTLEEGLMAGDLDQLDWGVGSHGLIKTPDNLYALLICKSIDDALIEFELKGIDKDGALLGKVYPITYLQAMADAESTMVTTVEINIDGNDISLKEKSSYGGKEQSKQTTKLKITAQGIVK